MNIRILTIATLISTLFGCSSLPESNVALDRAQSQLNAAENNPQVTSFAAKELSEAQTTFQQAKTSWKNKEDPTKTNHLAYMATQRVKIAENMASSMKSQSTIANAGAERDQLLLRARTSEANQAEERSRASAAALAAAEREATENALQHEKRVNELELELKSLNAKQTERGMVITLGDVLFKTGKSEISGNVGPMISKLADFLKRYPQQQASIEGHTDSTGTKEGNHALSQRRANAVQAALLNQGVSRNQLRTQAFGQSKPIADNSTSDGRRLNRRVEVVFDQTAE